MARTKTEDPTIWARIRAFDIELRGRVATRVATRHGFALRFPARELWDLNFAYVEHRAAPAAELIRDADEALAGLAHRMLVVDEAEQPDAPRRLASELTRAGWTVERHIAMLAGTVPPERVIRQAVQELPARSVLAARREALREDAVSPAVVMAIEAADAAVGAAAAERTFVSRAGDGSIAALAKLYTDGTIGQVEDVHTMQERRGQGHGQSVVLGALGASRDAGHELTFLWADEDDWPRELYGRLGFSVVGRRWRFRRRA